MKESLTDASGKTGLPPGSLVHVGDVLLQHTALSLIDFTKDTFTETPVDTVDTIAKYRDSETVTWLLVEGLADTAVIRRIGELFNIHQLVLEDILNTHQRPKFEEYEDYLFIVIKSLVAQEGDFRVVSEQVSLLVLPNFVIVFKEKQDDILSPVQQRIRASKGRFRSRGADFLAYSILDTIIDQGFNVLDLLDDEINALEDGLLGAEQGQAMLNTILRLKREIVGIRRCVSPVRELLNDMLRSESPLIVQDTHIYLRDAYDHAIRILESIEIHRDLLAGLLDIYISSVNNKMNEVMKVLTVFASIFIPLTFLAGIYGMNFDYMPELHWRWAYPALWLVFIATPVVLLVYFRNKDWL
ncbi:MAG: magnesium/cobalt transporter CorA [Halioglobus sp.]|nr:magnesium/cobalt transporter CorA [Halioglobus sp.]